MGVKDKIPEREFRGSVALVNMRDDFVRAYVALQKIGEPLRITGVNTDQTYGSKTVKLPEGLQAAILSTLLEDIRACEQRLSQTHNVYLKPFDPAKPEDAYP